MTTAIATQLQAIIDSQTKLVSFNQATSSWQAKIAEALALDSNCQSLQVIFPSTIEILAKVVAISAKNKWGLLICGNGSKLAWGNSSQDVQLVISTQQCDRLIEHAVGDLTVTVEAGMTLKNLQAILRSHNQFLPIDPSYPDTATLGGIVATADTGSWRQRYGGVRDLLLGLSFVRGDGAIAKAGGRVVKNVAGYDLMKLFTGAYGTLGIISQLTFRTYPLVSNSETLLLAGKAKPLAQACQTIRNSGLTPTILDLVSGKIVKQLEVDEDLGLIIRWQTIAESITQQKEQIKAIATELNLVTKNYHEQAEKDFWQKYSTIVSLPDSDNTVACKIGIAPTAAANFLQLEGVISNNIPVKIHASSGIGKLKLNEANVKLIAEMRSYCENNRGFLTILDAPSKIKPQLDVWGYKGNAIKTMQAIKHQFDPQNILNPNRFIV